MSTPNLPRTALITGANKGIGLEVARQLAARGWRVFLGARDPARGEAAAAQIREAGHAAEFLALDVADTMSIGEAGAELGRRTKSLDVLVNNAAILENSGVSVLATTAGEFDRTWRTNTLGPILVAQSVAPLLRAGERAAIINVSSGWGALADMSDEASAYGISKAGLNAVTRQMADAFSRDHVTVNSVCPGWVRTEMGGAGATRSVAQGAETIVWLATEAPRSLTGKFLRDHEEIAW